jgi:hypothetical protein
MISIAQIEQDIKDEFAHLQATAKQDFTALRTKLQSLFSHPAVVVAAQNPVLNPSPPIVVQPADRVLPPFSSTPPAQNSSTPHVVVDPVVPPYSSTPLVVPQVYPNVPYSNVVMPASVTTPLIVTSTPGVVTTSPAPVATSPAPVITPTPGGTMTGD